jgi:ubiquinone/menaquinone biosynthesis C-methylase UbiE
VGVTSGLNRLYWWLERRLAPGVQYAQSTYEDSLFACVEPGCEWLDLGCGHTLLPEWRASAERTITGLPARLVGVDPDRSSLRGHRTIRLRVCADGGSLPFADGQFDLVTANMVVEHLADPEKQFREVWRVLAPRGRFLFHTPNGTGYPTLLARTVPDLVRGVLARLIEGRAEGDRFRTYYLANTPSRIGALAVTTGFAVGRIDLIRSSAMLPRITPLAAAELLFLRAMAAPPLSWLRPNLIAVLRKE